jgi:predicted transcriptional regulator
MADDRLIELTADIVAAHVSNNHVALGDVANLVQRVHEALAVLKIPATASKPESKGPVVSVRSSVKPDYLVCLVCGKKQKTLKRHLAIAHNLTAEQYRQEFNLAASYPMTAPNYSETRRTMAHSIGLGRKPAATAERNGARKSAAGAPKAKSGARRSGSGGAPKKAPKSATRPNGSGEAPAEA